MYTGRLRENLPRVRERIESARERAGGAVDVDLVTVTKGHPLAAVEAALDAGLTRIGENRVGELETKAAEVRDERVEWHMVGHLQRNKARRALPLIHMLQSIDSLRLARKLSSEAKRAETDLVGLVQVNTSGEAAKSGFEFDETVEAVAEIAEMDRLRVRGLMTMAPLTDDEAVLRETFRRARELFDTCASEVTGFDARHLSMGMSNDFEIAIEEGSTMVRLGTVLLGERKR